MHTKRSILKNLIMSITLIMSACIFTGCASKSSEADEEKAVKVYYVNNSETAIVSQDYVLQSELSDVEGCVDELLLQMETLPAKLEYEAPITGNVDIIEYSIANGILTLNFEATYYDLEKYVEILDRAAMVRTLSQVEGIDYVSFNIEGSPLVDSEGMIIGNMSSDMFVYNAGNEINSYEKVELTLYFANQAGDKLVPVYRSVVYNSNISMERLVVEQLISGPNANISYPTINSSTKINSISVKDGICYVDFDSNFLNQNNSVSAEVAIYSIVDTLAEISNVNKVQFSVDGSSNVTYMESISLANPFERNLDIIDN